ETTASEVWAVTQHTTSVAVLEDFIRQFGNTPYGRLARARLEELKGSQVAVVAPPMVPAVPSRLCGAGEVIVSLSSRVAAPLSPAEECSLKPKDIFKECATCPEMVVVPAGTFTMGSPKSEAERDDREDPQHPVTVGKAFAVGKFHVTF